MKEVINNNNKCKLKYWFAMLYIHCGKFMTGSVFTYQRLIYFIDLLKFGRRFSHAQLLDRYLLAEFYPYQHLLISSQQWKQQNNV